MHTSHNIAYNLIRVLANRLRGDNSLISRTQELQREYEHYAVIDSLTGLYNRRWLDNMLQGQMDRWQDTHRKISILLMDLDGFTGYNDTYGHLAGDHVLCAVGQTLAGGMRAGEMIACYGATSSSSLCPTLQWICLNPLPSGSGDPCERIPWVRNGISFPMPKQDASSTLLARADEVLYQNKESRRKSSRRMLSWYSSPINVILKVGIESKNDGHIRLLPSPKHP